MSDPKWKKCKIKKDNGEMLKLDAGVDATSIDKTIKSIIDHINKAKMEAIRNCIKANTIIIDEEIAKINGLTTSFDGATLTQIRPSICGLKIKYQQNLVKDYGFNFMICEVEETKPTLADYSDEELLNELLERRKHDD